MFQADSILCSNSEQQLEDFLEWDFVGAPINEELLPGFSGFNGGLSLRNRTLTLSIVEEWDFEEEKEAGGIVFEDQWFFAKMKERRRRGEDVYLPSIEEAQSFSVETIWVERPLGYHQVGRWQADKMGEVLKWCPEYALATKDLIVNHRE